MATIILNQNETSTIANDGDIVRGRQEGAEAIRIESGVTDIETNAELEQIDLPAFSSGDLSFQVTDNGLAISAGGNTIVTVPSLNQNLNLRLTDGNVTLSQTGAQQFTLTNPTDSNDTATIGTESTGLTVGLGDRADSNDFELTPQDASVKEGESITYTLTTNVAVNSATDVNFSVIPGDANAPDQGTNNTNLNDFQQGAFNPSTVTIAQGDKQAEFTLNTSNEGLTELPEEFDVQAEVNGETVTVDTTLLDGSGFALTTDPNDTFTGDSNPDTFTAGLGTLQTGDILEGLGGDDTLNARISSNTPAPTLASVDNINLNSRGNAGISLANASGTTNASVTGSGDASITNASDSLTSFSVSGNSTDGAYDSLALLEFVDGSFSDPDESLNLSLTNLDGATVAIGENSNGSTDELETLNIESNGSSTNTFELDFADNLTGNPLEMVGEAIITGDVSAVITVDSAEVDLNNRSVNASGLNGTLQGITDQTSDINASNIVGLDKLTLTADTSGILISELEENTTVELQSANGGNVEIQQQGADAAGSLDDTIDVVLNADSTGTVTQNGLTANDIETLNLESTSSVNDPSTVTNEISTLTADALGTLNVTGDANLDIGQPAEQVDVVDADSFSGALTANFSANNTAAVAATTGSGNDVLTSSTFDDDFDLGGGDDTLTVNGEARTGETATVNTTTGSGADTIDHVTGTGALESIISDFSVGTDELATDDNQFDASGLTNETEIANFINDAVGTNAVAGDINLLQAGGAAASAIFEFDGSTRIAGSTDQTFDDGDALITLEGVTGTAAGNVGDFFA